MALMREKIYTIDDIYTLPEGHRAELIDGHIYVNPMKKTVIVFDLGNEEKSNQYDFDKTSSSTFMRQPHLFSYVLTSYFLSFLSKAQTNCESFVKFFHSSFA